MRGLGVLKARRLQRAGRRDGTAWPWLLKIRDANLKICQLDLKIIRANLKMRQLDLKIAWMDLKIPETDQKYCAASF